MLPNLVQASHKINCETNPIYCQILKVNSRVDKGFALKLSDYISKYSLSFGTNPMISVAIAMKESSIRNQHKMGLILSNDNKEIEGITDFGVFQIHMRTIKDVRERLGWHIDTARLKNDVEYQTYWHTRILKMKIKTCSKPSVKVRRKIKDGNEWTCYHSGTLSKRLTYLKEASPYLKK